MRLYTFDVKGRMSRRPLLGAEDNGSLIDLAAAYAALAEAREAAVAAAGTTEGLPLRGLPMLLAAGERGLEAARAALQFGRQAAGDSAGHLRYDFKNPENPNNDHLILSKGHAAPLLYAVYKAAGAITDDELMSLRKPGSRLEGHPTPALPWVDVATGSLGQGLPIGVGIMFQFLSPGYISPLFHTLVGKAMLGVAVVLEIVGVMIIQRILNIEV